MKKRIAYVIGIRPDVVRSSLILKLLKSRKEVEVFFIWSGQHYSDNLKDVFFRELDIPKPDIDLGCRGLTDAEISGKLIINLSKTLISLKPDVAVFLGDNNTVTGSIAAAQLNIPIAHIEGCMRSYDWRLPEEKYRILLDHISDVIYAYQEEHNRQGVAEGLNPKNIVVVGNPIVDVLNEYYFKQREKYSKFADNNFFDSRGIKKHEYYLMTTHRRENVHDEQSFKAVLNLVSKAPFKVYFPASYRTQKIIQEMNIKLPKNIIMLDPLGYQEFLTLLVNSRGMITDSGTVTEEACILQIPSIQLRKSTERSEVYEVKSSVKFDPTNPDKYPSDLVFKKAESIFGKKWKHTLGDGKTSARIVNDLVNRLLENRLSGHLPENSHISVERSYREDEISI